VGCRQGAEGALGLGVPGAQGGGEGELLAFVKALDGHRAEHRVRAELERGGGAFAEQGRDRGGEAHGLPGVGDPMSGVRGALGPQQLAAQAGDERGVGSAELEALACLRELPEHRVHQRRVEGVGDIQAFGPLAQLLPGGFALLDRRGGTGDDAGAGRVDRRQGELGLPARDQLEGFSLRRLDRQHRAALG
jgi:hypothetical protein